MTYIRYKKFKNNTYAYEVTSIWDTKLKQSRSKSRYIGKVNEQTKQLILTVKKSKTTEKLILDFGDGYFLYEFIKNNKLYCILKTHLFDLQPALMPLIIYRLCSKSSIHNYKNWLEGNVLSLFFKDINMTSSKISELLEFLGSEQVQNSFFSDYLKLIGKNKTSIIIDIISQSNQSNVYFNTGGHADDSVDKQFKLLYVVDQKSKLPLFYCFLPDDITKINTLELTISELKKLGIQNSFTLLGTSYFSKINIKDFYDRKIDFVIKLPDNRSIFKDIILKKSKDLESTKYAQVYGDKTIFVKEIKIDLFGFAANAYIVLDLDHKAREVTNFVETYCEEALKQDKNQSKLAFASCGIFILVSSKSIKVQEVLSCYHAKQSIEQIFSFSKKDFSAMPICNNNAVRGYLFLQLILLILFIQVREKNYTDYTIEQMFMILRKLKCKVFDDQIIPQELLEEQKVILQKYNIIVPTSLRI